MHNTLVFQGVSVFFIIINKDKDNLYVIFECKYISYSQFS